jgi:hypothetical protein
MQYPFAPFTDVRIPFRFNVNHRMSFFLTGAVERAYAMQSPSDIMGSRSGVPMSSFSGVQTEQLSVLYGFTIRF